MVEITYIMYVFGNNKHQQLTVGGVLPVSPSVALQLMLGKFTNKSIYANLQDCANLTEMFENSVNVPGTWVKVESSTCDGVEFSWEALYLAILVDR